MFFLSELMGTLVLVAMGCGVAANVLLEKSKGQNSGWIVITAGWGIAVMCGLSVAFALGGPGWLNPAVAVAALVVDDPGASVIAVGIAAEFAGGFLGAVVVYLAYLPHWRATPYPELKLAVFATDPSLRSPWANGLTEALATGTLVFVLRAIMAARPGSTLVALTAGALVWGLGLSFGGPTGFALNPARDLGPRLAHALLPLPGKGSSDWGYAWVPVVGPLLGGLGGAALWALVVAHR